MATEYEIYEKEVEKIIKENEVYLEKFAKWLEEKGLSPKTIRNHVGNVDFYINDFLCYYEPQNYIAGCHNIHGFLGDWFIRKALWSSQAYVKSTAASIKKFYSFMLEEGKVSTEDYQELCEDIKELMPEWLESMQRFDNLAYEE